MREKTKWISEREWLYEIFPEAREYVLEKLEETEKRKNVLLNRFWLHANAIPKTLTGFELWFVRKLVNVFYGDDYREANKEAKSLTMLLYPPKLKEGSLTDEQIARARQYPIFQILGVEHDRHNVRCPFHNNGQEKKPSLNIKNNFFYCHTCGEHGDTIDLAIKLKGQNFKEAVIALQ